MTEKDEIRKNIPGTDANPFKVPDRYFEDFESRLVNRIKVENPVDNTEEKESKSKGSKISLKPYLALVASISGIALITFTILQFVIGGRYYSDENYDLALLEESGIIIDEASISEIYNSETLDEDTSWEEEAMNYLASKEVELEYLLAMN